MKLVDARITLGELRSMAGARFGDLVKAVVDVRKGVMVVDGNIRPFQGNRSRGVDDPEMQTHIVTVVESPVPE